MREKIICSAVYLPELDKIFYGHRHSHCIQAMNSELSWTMNRQEIAKVEKIQGFVTTEGRFVNREEAGIIFEKSTGKKMENPPRLFSEDIY